MSDLLVFFFFFLCTVPAEPVPSLEASQDESSAVLSWQEIPMLSQRGFVRGYSVYLASASGYTLLGNAELNDNKSQIGRAWVYGFLQRLDHDQNSCMYGKVCVHSLCSLKTDSSCVLTKRNGQQKYLQIALE